MLKRIAVVIMAVIFTGTASADNVYLKNGQVYTECVAKTLPNGNVEITMKGGKIILPQTEIAYIEKEQVNEEDLKAGEPELSAVLKAWEAAKGKKETGTEAKPDETAKQVQQLVELFNDRDTTVRDQAVESLVAMGAKATPYLLPFLKSDDQAVRLHVSAVFAQTRPKNAVRQLLEALYAGSPPAGRAPYFMIDYLTNINTALITVTGQSFNYLPSIDSQFEAVDKYVAWYKANAMTLPPQIGDPAKKEGADDKAYEEELKKAREFKGVRRPFAAPGAAAPETEAPVTPPLPAESQPESPQKEY